ncbi:MAG: ATP-dependent Clp protease adaptor ClpS [Ignavibacteria bacterium]
MSTKSFKKPVSDDTVLELRKLILFNSTHIWDEVVFQLEKATGFDSLHCEQIAMIAHTKGKAVVKSGDPPELEKINNILKEINLVTSIE